MTGFLPSSSRYNNPLQNSRGKEDMRRVYAGTALQETLVVIPVVLSIKADGNSAVTFRRRYLKLTIESLVPFFKFIAVFVMNAEDAVELNTLNLPIWKIVRIENLAQNCALPAASMVEVARKIQNEVYCALFQWFSL
jgi:hypothetical protein